MEWLNVQACSWLADEADSAAGRRFGDRVSSLGAPCGGEVQRLSIRALFARACLVLCVFLLGGPGVTGADWPGWRADAGRSGITSDTLADTLHLQWSRRLSEPQAAWPDDPQLQFDAFPTPVVAGGLVLVADAVTDSVDAFDAGTGARVWRFRSNGPVRVPPAVWKGLVFIAGDDGSVTCVSLDSGEMQWRFFAPPNHRKALGNERLISLWPSRGGPVAADGKVYVASGVWPMMGITIACLDAATGEPIWTNERAGTIYYPSDQWTGGTFGGVSPQGCLVLDWDTLWVPSGRAWPMAFDAASGEMRLPYDAGRKDYAGGGNARICAASGRLAMGGFLMDVARSRAIVFNDQPQRLKPFNGLPLIDSGFVCAATGNVIEAWDLSDTDATPYTGAYGAPLLRVDAPLLWSVDAGERVVRMVRAGDHLVAALSGQVVLFRLEQGAVPVATWRGTFSGEPGSLAVADGRLFVSTRDGWLHCFGEGDGTATIFDLPPPEQPAPGDASQVAAGMLGDSGVAQGYCLVAGLTDGRLVEGLLEQSELRVIAIDEDPVRVNRLRDRLEALGMSGPRASAYIGTPGDFGLPRWFASLVVSEDWSRAGVSPGEAGSFFECLRPCGGVACLSGADGTALGVAAARADGEQFRISRREEWTFLERPGPLPGASDWTHEACDAGNTRFSRDRRVRAPLGVLWFGGAAGARSLYFSRYGDPATPRVVDGRMILHSPGRFTAVDIYTGVVLWQSRLPEGGGVSRSRSNIESGIKGLANGQHAATQASFVACPEAIYVAWGRKLFALDPATGGRVREYEVSPDPGHAEPPRLGHVWVVGGTLVVGAGYEDADPEPLFVDSDFAQMPAERLAALLATIAHWPRADQASAARGNEPDRSRAARGLNCLLDEPELETLIPSAFLEGRADDPAPETSVRDALEELKKERQRRSDRTPYVSIRYANRRFLEALWPGIEPLPVKKYYHNLYPWDGMATTQLIGIDIGSGRQLWRVRARRAFPQKGVSAGNGRVYFVDRADPDRLDFLERRGIDVDRSAEVIALDASDGRELWRQSSEFSGYRTLYSSDRDIVVLGSPFDPDPALWTKPRDQGVRYTAWRGEDGSPLWDKPLTVHRGAGRHRMWYDWFLYDDIIITESYSDTHSDHYGMDLGTGELLTRTSPLTGNRLDWGFRRTRGCGRDLACEQLVLFRSSMAGYYRIGDDGGTANLAGFRSGCKNSLIPAGGILNAPNFAQGCTCNYPVFTALALAHDPGVEAWAANDFAYDGGSVAQLGVNLGAPGDYRDDGGLLWLDVPSAGGPSPDVPVAIEPESDSIRWFYTHSARLGGEAPRRVGASGAEGVQSVRIQLNPAGGAKRRYTVRLVFSEPDALAPGERVFDVAMQNVTCLEGYDIFARAGGRNRAIEECVEPVEVEKDLVVTLKSVRGRPILCGIAVQAEDAVP